MQHDRCSQITCNSRNHRLQCTYHGAGWTLAKKTEDTLNRHQYDFPAITTTAVVTNATHLNRRVERVENVIGGVSAAPIAPCDFPFGATPVRSALTVTVIHLLTLVPPTITNIILRLKKKKQRTHSSLNFTSRGEGQMHITTTTRYNRRRLGITDDDPV